MDDTTPHTPCDDSSHVEPDEPYIPYRSFGHQILLTLIVVSLLPHGLPTQSPMWGSSQALGSFFHPAINEASGIVVSHSNPDLLWIHNDSGDGAYLYLIDRNARVKAKVRMRGGSFRDVEDIAIGPCEPPPHEDFSKTCLYIADIGDNRHRYHHVHIHKLEEPNLTKKTLPTNISVEKTYHLVYPKGAYDAEGLMIHPKTARLYVLQKARKGDAGLFEVPRDTSSVCKNPGTMKHIRDFPLQHPQRAGRMFTGADISPDGRCMVFRTYAEIHTRCLPDTTQTFSSIFDLPADVVRTVPMFQSEAITFDTRQQGLFVTSERWLSPLVYVHPRQNKP